MSDDPRWLETGRLAELGLMATELSHELRQPLFAAKALLQLVARDSTTDPRVAAALDQLAHMEAVVDRWAVTGRRPGRLRTAVALHATVRKGAELLRARVRNAGKAFSLDPRGPETVVLADPVSVQQITVNLVANAVDAARSRVEVRTEGPVLRVIDDGPGIPEALRDRIYEPFFSTKPPGDGTGLGLAITRNLIEAAGARLECDPGPHGTVFEVHFVAADPAPPARAG